MLKYEESAGLKDYLMNSSGVHKCGVIHSSESN